MIALLAGEGALPAVVARSLQGRYLLCALEGYAPDFATPDKVFRIERLGSFIAGLKAEGVRQICLAGRVARPAIDPTLIDAETMPLVPRMMQALQAGDDAALRVVLAFFEEAGIAPVAAHELAADVLPPEGVLAGAVTDQDHRDLARARAVHAALSAVDVGQGCVVARGQVLAVEATPGTDWMLRSIRPTRVTRKPVPDPGDPFEWAIGGVADWLGGDGAPAPNPEPTPNFPRPEGGLLFKAPKAGQDLRVDMPVVGPETAKRAAEAGLNGIAIEAGGVMALDLTALRQTCQAVGLFLWVVPRL